MHRSQLETKYLKSKIQTDFKLYKKHKTFVVNYAKGKEGNIESLDMKNILDVFSVNKDFHFSNTEVSDIIRETTALNNKKNGTFGNIPTKLLKEVSDICAPALNDIWNNEIITQKCFPNNLKLADVTPVFKKRMLHY